MGWIKAYKGFDSNLQGQPDYRMRPFQYKVGEEYIGDNDVRRKDVKCFYIDGKTIKENVEYTLVNGEPVEASKVWNSDSRE